MAITLTQLAFTPYGYGPDQVTSYMHPPVNNADLGYQVATCPTKVEYHPGVARGQYLNFTEYWLGQPWVAFLFDRLPAAEWAMVMNAYQANKTPVLLPVQFSSPYWSASRYWFMFLNANNGGAWELQAGIMDEPQQDGFSGGGDYATNVRITFSLGLQYEQAADAVATPGEPGANSFGDGVYANNTWTL